MSDQEAIDLLYKYLIKHEINQSDQTSKIAWADQLIAEFIQKERCLVLPTYTPRTDFETLDKTNKYIEYILKHKDLIDQIQQRPAKSITLDRDYQVVLVECFEALKTLLEPLRDVENDILVKGSLPKGFPMVEHNLDEVKHLIKEFYN